MVHILALELLNAIDFMTAILGIPLYLLPLQDLYGEQGPDDDGYYSADRTLSARLIILFNLSNTAFVLCGLLTDGILVRLAAILMSTS